MNDPKEIKQKYAGCWLPLKCPDKIVYGQLVDINANGIAQYTHSTGSFQFNIPDPKYQLLFENPKTGFVYIPAHQDTYLILRRAEKQFKRGFHPDNYQAISLTKIAMRTAVTGATGINVNKNVQAIGNRSQEFFSVFDMVEAAYNRTFKSFDWAIKAGHAVALSNRLAVIPSSNKLYDLDIFREAYKIGSIEIKDRLMTVSPLFVQELVDYVRRNNLDWRVTNATQ